MLRISSTSLPCISKPQRYETYSSHFYFRSMKIAEAHNTERMYPRLYWFRPSILVLLHNIQRILTVRKHIGGSNNSSCTTICSYDTSVWDLLGLNVGSICIQRRFLERHLWVFTFNWCIISFHCRKMACIVSALRMHKGEFSVTWKPMKRICFMLILKSLMYLLSILKGHYSYFKNLQTIF